MVQQRSTSSGTQIPRNRLSTNSVHSLCISPRILGWDPSRNANVIRGDHLVGIADALGARAPRLSELYRSLRISERLDTGQDRTFARGHINRLARHHLGGM